MWALSEARKVELTRSITALAKPAGETYLGAHSYDEAYKTDSILQVGHESKTFLVTGTFG